MSTRSYLDHAAGSPMPPAVRAEMSAWFAVPGNPNSLHHAGRAARRALEEAREELAALVGAHPDEVVFTAGGTEANNLALTGSARAGRARLAISAVEHPSVGGVRERSDLVDVLAVDTDGRVLVCELDRLGATTALTSVMWVNNETGVINDVAAVSEAAHRVGAWAHTDAVQAVGHLPVNFADSGADLLSMSAHKLGGPVGIGALIRRRGITLAPTGFGGGQEAKLRSGTVAVALAVGFAAAARQAAAGRAQETARLADLRARLLAGVAAIPQTRNNSTEPASPAIVNLTFGGTRADDLLLLLDAAGIDASTGSACTAGLHQPSDVLQAMGRSRADAGASLRFSFGWSTTADDIDRLLAALPDAVGRARLAAAG